MTGMAGTLQHVGHDLSDVPGAHRFLGALGLDAIAKHYEAIGTGSRHRVRSGAEQLLGALDVHPLVRLFFHPHMPAPTATAETGLAGAGHLHTRSPGRLQYRPRLGVDVVVAAQVAGVVVGDLALRLGRFQLELAISNQASDELRVVDHLEAAPELRVLVPESIEAVGTAGHNLFDIVLLERLD